MDWTRPRSSLTRHTAEAITWCKASRVLIPMPIIAIPNSLGLVILDRKMCEKYSQNQTGVQIEDEDE